MAAINGWLKVAAYLLDHGADVNAGQVACEAPLSCRQSGQPGDGGIFAQRGRT